MRNRYTSSAASLLLGAVIACSSATIAEAQEPIAFIGHGVMFDAAGSSIEATPAFIESAQNFYIAKLSAQLQPAQKKSFDAHRAHQLDTLRRPSAEGSPAGDKQDALVINASLIDWLIKEVPLSDSGDLQGKNNLIKAMLRYRLFPPEIGAPYAAPQELLNLLKYQVPDTRKN